MALQAFNVAQKVYGYKDAKGTMTTGLLSAAKAADAGIASWIAALKKHKLYGKTTIILASKHGQSPIDSSKVRLIAAPILICCNGVLQVCLRQLQDGLNPLTHTAISRPAGACER